MKWIRIGGEGDKMAHLEHLRGLEHQSKVMMMMTTTTTTMMMMMTNRLFFNPFEIQAIWISGHMQIAKIDYQRLSSLFPHMTFTTSVHDLGVMLEPELTFRSI